MWNTTSIILDEATIEKLGFDRAGAIALVRSLLKAQGRPLKSDDRSDVRLHQADGRGWVVKRYSVSGGKLWAYRMFRLSRGWREWRGARRLIDAGVRCSMPVALVHDRSTGRWAESLVLPYVEGRNVAGWLFRNTDERRRRHVANRVGLQVGVMSAAGIINRDHKATNVIVDELCATGRAMPVVIDPAGLRRRRSDRQVYQMMALLYASAGRRTPVPFRLALRALQAALEADPSIAASSPSRLRRALDGIQRAGAGMRSLADERRL